MPRRRFPYKCNTAAGAFPIEVVLRSTNQTQKKKKQEEEDTNNLAVPDPRTYAQGSNRPFGLSPLALIKLPLVNYKERFTMAK